MVDIDVQYVFQKKVLLICPFDLEIFSSIVNMTHISKQLLSNEYFSSFGLH